MLVKDCFDGSVLGYTLAYIQAAYLPLLWLNLALSTKLSG